MHENREISCTSCPLRQDRSVKAINYNADVNVQEKSDCAVIPVNRPNKEGQPSAEVGEGRTAENRVQSRMLPTQSVNRMSLGLAGVRQAASVRSRNGSPRRDSFFALKRPAAPGAHGVTWQEYEAGLESAFLIFIAGRTEERIDRRDESTDRKLMGGSAR